MQLEKCSQVTPELNTIFLGTLLFPKKVVYITNEEI